MGLIFPLPVERQRNSSIKNRKFWRIISTVKRIEYVSDRVSYIDRRGRWCNIIIVNVLTPSEVKSDELK